MVGGAKMILRYYQQEASDAIEAFVKTETGNGLVVIPTGAGKSLVIAETIKRFHDYRILMVVHSKKIISQNYRTTIEHVQGIDIGICSSGLDRFDTTNKVIFGGIATIKQRDIGYFDIVLFDESHLLSDNEKSMYQKTFSSFKALNPNLRVIGFTATPFRNGKGLLLDGKNFHKTIYDISGWQEYNKLVDQGFLAKMISKPVENLIDTKDVDIVKGDYNISQLQEAVKKNDVTVKAIKEAVKLSTGRKKWLVFGSGIEHVIEITNMLNICGVTATCVHSKQEDSINDKNLEDYENDIYTAIVSNGILTTGFDCPRIDLLICLRPTTSVSLWIQMLGRAGRVHPSKENALILDFAYNCIRLGCINDPIIPKKKGKGSGEAPTKTCPACNCANHLSARQCFFCGAIFVIQKKIMKHASAERIIKTLDTEPQYSKCIRQSFELRKKGNHSYLLIKYHCEGVTLYDYFMPEMNEWWAKAKAKKWWLYRMPNIPMPFKASGAFDKKDLIPKPNRIKWNYGRELPDIIAFEYFINGEKKIIQKNPPTQKQIKKKKLEAKLLQSQLFKDD